MCDFMIEKYDMIDLNRRRTLAYTNFILDSVILEKQESLQFADLNCKLSL